MLVPNATLLIQVINFFIAYGIVRFFIVKPLLALIQQEDAQAASLAQAVQERQMTIENKRHELEVYWSECKDHFASHTPSISHRPLPLSGKAQISVAVSSAAQQEKLAQELAQGITAEVSHVR